jgi:uncharacterized spore protein YtfJ
MYLRHEKMENKMENGGSAHKSLVERIAESLGGAANAARIYGTPIEREGVTVIPVSKASYGFGGGTGKKAGDEGSGGGGGMMLTPIGYIEIKQGDTRFRSIRDPQTVMKIVAISGLFTFLTVKSILKLLKR